MFMDIYCIEKFLLEFACSKLTRIKLTLRKELIYFFLLLRSLLIKNEKLLTEVILPAIH